MLKATCLGLAVLLGLALAANGIFMLVSPEHWYVAVPGVTSTGPFNQHFLRDIGLIFVFLGGAFLLGAARPQVRVLLWGLPQSGCSATPCFISGKWLSASARPPTWCETFRLSRFRPSSRSRSPSGQ